MNVLVEQLPSCSELMCGWLAFDSSLRRQQLLPGCAADWPLDRLWTYSPVSQVPIMTCWFNQHQLLNYRAALLHYCSATSYNTTIKQYRKYVRRLLLTIHFHNNRQIQEFNTEGFIWPIFRRCAIILETIWGRRLRKEAFDSSCTALSKRCHQIWANVNGLGTRCQKGQKPVWGKTCK